MIKKANCSEIKKQISKEDADKEKAKGCFKIIELANRFKFL